MSSSSATFRLVRARRGALFLLRLVSAWGTELEKTCCLRSYIVNPGGSLGWAGLSLSVPRELAEPWPVLASLRLPAGGGEIPGKGQNPARQEQKLSLVTHNWWNICSNFFFPFPSDLAPPAHAKKLLYPLDLPGVWRAEPLCGSWDGMVGTCWSSCCGLWDCLPSPESHRALPHWPWEGPFFKTRGISPFLLKKPHDER